MFAILYRILMYAMFKIIEPKSIISGSAFELLFILTTDIYDVPS